MVYRRLVIRADAKLRRPQVRTHCRTRDMKLQCARLYKFRLGVSDAAGKTERAKIKCDSAGPHGGRQLTDLWPFIGPGKRYRDDEILSCWWTLSEMGFLPAPI